MRKLPIPTRLLPRSLRNLSVPWLSMVLAAAALTSAAAAQTGSMQAQPLAPGLTSTQTGAVPDGSGPVSSRTALFPGYSASPATERFPGYGATQAETARFPGYSASRVDTAQLSALPYVYALKRRDAAQMTRKDASLAAALQPELATQAALLRFDLSQPGWSYQQVVCPALPDYLLLSFYHGPDPSGSSRFTAVLDRDSPRVEVVSTFAHGMKPFTAAWSKPSTFELFSRMLRRERGAVPLGAAPNWLVIGLCYADLSGYPVQALTSTSEPDTTMDMERLGGNLPQMQVAPDHTTQITFSDVSRPGLTTDWLLNFDEHGRIVSAERTAVRQPARVALKP